MKTLAEETAKLIDQELRSIPEKYQKQFNSVHEGLAVLREEYVELENEIFFGEKQVDFIEGKEMSEIKAIHPMMDESNIWNHKDIVWRHRIKKEAIQVAAMAVRIIQELT